MTLMAPTWIAMPWATGGGPSQGAVNVIPQGSNAPYASFADGFPVQTMLAPGNGGVPPQGADFNGALQFITQYLVWLSAGQHAQWNSIVSVALGGYPLGAILQMNNGSGLVQSTVANNTNNPNVNMTGWTAVGGSSGSGCTRGTLNFTSGSLAPGASETDVVPTGADSFCFLNMTVSGPCRVRIYATAYFAAADLSRPSSQDPVGNFGMYLEMVFIPGVLTWTMAPVPVAVNQDTTESKQVYMTIQNLGTSTTTITLTSSILKME